MPDLSLTRIYAAEHSYPTPTRNHLSQQQRELAKARVPVKPKATELRCGYRAKDGTTYMFPTASEMEAHRKLVLADEALARKQRLQSTIDRLNESTARIDSWAHKE